MKKIFQSTFALVLCVALMLSVGAFAFADNAELPTEYVGYGYGNPDAAAVKMHDLEAENITLNGVSIDLRCENGYVFICLMDLASAKLLSENADKLAEYGLDINQLYISDGVIMVKPDGLTEDEIASIQAKLNEFLQDAGVSLSIGDKFELGNNGATKVYVEIGDFTTDEVAPTAVETPVESPEPSEDPEPSEEEPDTPPEEDPAPVPSVNPNALDVQVGKVYDISSASPEISMPSTLPTVTTIYVTYGYHTTDDQRSFESNINSHDFYEYSEEQNSYVYQYTKIFESYIYLIQSEHDGNIYYYSTDGGNTYTKLENTESSGSGTYEAVIGYGEWQHSGTDEVRDKINNTVISISTTGDKDGEIKTIKYADGTPEYDPDDKPVSEDGYNDGVTENRRLPNEWTRYAPDNSIEISSADPNTDDIVDAEEVTVTVKNDIVLMPSEEKMEAESQSPEEEPPTET